MPTDVLVEFYIATIKVQEKEYELLQGSSPNYRDLLHELEQCRCELGECTARLLSAAIPTCFRQSRSFRSKYTIEVDLSALERGLMTMANKVLNYTRGEIDTQPAQPSAIVYLDLVARVQSMVLSLLESILPSQQPDTPLMDPSETNEPSSSSSSCTKVHQLDVSACIKLAAAATRTEEPYEEPQEPNRSAEGEETTDRFAENPLRERRRRRSILDVDTSCADDGSNRRDAVERLISNVSTLTASSSLCITDELTNALVQLDCAMARFEYELIRVHSTRMRTARQVEDVYIVAVLFSETLMWALAVGLIRKSHLADRDPKILLSLPRLAVLVGCRLLPGGPIGSEVINTGGRLPFMFSESRSDVAYLIRQLAALNLEEICRLAYWLGPRGIPSSVYHRACQPAEPLNTPSTRCRSPQLLTSDQVFLRDVNAGDVHLSHASSSTGPDSPVPIEVTPKPRHVSRINVLGLHRLYKRISSVADRLSTDFSSELRLMLQIAIELNDSSSQDEALQEGEADPSSFSMPVVDDHSEDSSESTSGDEEERLEEECDLKSSIQGLAKQTSLAKLLDWSNAIFSSLQGQTLSLKSVHRRRKSVRKTPPLTPSRRFSKKSSVEVGEDVLAWLYENSSVPSENSSSSAYRESSSGQRSGVFRGAWWTGIQPWILQGEVNREEVARPMPHWQPDHVQRHPQRSQSRSAIVLEDSLHDHSDGEFPLALIQTDTENTSDDEDAESTSSEEAVYVSGKQCAACCKRFTIIRRRHHCRRCGHVFCAGCCDCWLPVEGLADGKSVRVCLECHEFLMARSLSDNRGCAALKQ